MSGATTPMRMSDRHAAKAAAASTVLMPMCRSVCLYMYREGSRGDGAYEPSQQEVEEYAEWLGMNLEQGTVFFFLRRLFCSPGPAQLT